MGRWARQVVLPGTLGAVTTVATAWLLALRPLETMFERITPSPLDSGNLVVGTERASLSVSVEQGIGWMWVGTRYEGHAETLRSSAAGAAWHRLNDSVDASLVEPFDRMAQTASGWPMLAMTYQVEPGGRVSRGIRLVARAHPFWSRSGMIQALPLSPLRVGFLVDTIAFAAAWWAILFGPSALRRLRAARRGACRACGYDLAASKDASRCPECGYTLSRGAV